MAPVVLKSECMRSRGPVIIEQLARADLEALATFKLWTEVGVTPDRSRELFDRATQTWLIRYVGSLPRAVGSDPLDESILLRARAEFYRPSTPAVPAGRRPARRAFDFDSSDNTCTNLTMAA